MEHHDPAHVIDAPRDVAAAGGDRSAEGVLEGAAFSRRIDAGLRHGAGEISRQDGLLGGTQELVPLGEERTDQRNYWRLASLAFFWRRFWHVIRGWLESATVLTVLTVSCRTR